MFSNLTVGKRLVAGFGLSAITLIVIAISAYYNVNRQIDSDEWVRHTYQVRDKLTDLTDGFLDGQTGVRGFIITGDESFLEPYKKGIAAIPALITDLTRLTADNPRQQERFARLAPMAEEKFKQFLAEIDLRRGQGLDAAAKAVATGESKRTMDRIRATIREAEQEEASLLQKRTEEARSASNQSIWIIVWGGLIGTLAVAAISWFISRSLADQIGKAVGQVQSSSSELQAAANQQATGAKEQAAAIAEISTTISELLATSRQIAESAQRVAHNAEQTANSACSGHGTVDLTHESITGIRRQVDQIVSHMLELGKKSQQIGSVLDIVSELAEQTNILAINATIEAAGAGEAGKRFATVAEEIRKLADRVGGSTKEVRVLIDDVRSAVNTTVMATETGSKAVDAGTRQFADVASTFKQIANLVGTTTDAAREIELSTKQQASAVEQVNTAIASVTQASVETETSAGQTLQTVSQMASLSKNLLRIIRPHMAA
ncbi:MAG: CHASE3 domain-containing protein [Pseudolabrys sp.]